MPPLGHTENRQSGDVRVASAGMPVVCLTGTVGIVFLSSGCEVGGTAIDDEGRRVPGGPDWTELEIRHTDLGWVVSVHVCPVVLWGA
jgi:hypothetical protein